MKRTSQQKYSVYVQYSLTYTKGKEFNSPSFRGVDVFIFLRFLLQADQLVSEKMTGAEHTKMDEDFTRLEQQTDVYVEMQVLYRRRLCSYREAKNVM
jgi:hypothetical protein